MLESDINNIGQFAIKVRVGSAEIEVSAPDKDFVLNESNRLIEQFKLDAVASLSTHVEIIQGEVAALPEAPRNRVEKPQTLAEFFRQFVGLQTNLDKTLVFGYWCEIKQSQPHFTSEDILARYKEAKEAQPQNIKRDLGSLVSKGFLLSPDKSNDGALTYSLSNSGIKEVEAKMSQK
ncbi:MAG: hypothetical protein E6J34_17855 [Chloroflexi bacterium]|nr:MAG: hypothetical protein E6J34_17855 [Chloroflexota bacterium]